MAARGVGPVSPAEALAFVAVAVLVALFVGVRLILGELDASTKAILGALQRKHGPPSPEKAPIGFRPAPRASDAPRSMYVGHAVEIIHAPYHSIDTERERERCR